MSYVVCAPGKIPRASGDRLKTDRRDAEHLVRLLLAGELHAVRVPGREGGAARPRPCPRDVRVDLIAPATSSPNCCCVTACPLGSAWTQRHARWLARIQLPHPAAHATLLDYHGAVGGLVHR